MAVENEKRYIKEAEEIISKILSEHIGSAMDAYVKIFDAGRLADGWIDCKKEDAPINENVLLCNAKDGWVVAGHRDRKGKYWNQFTDKFNDVDIVVTHWKPLPEPPTAS